VSDRIERFVSCVVLCRGTPEQLVGFVADLTRVLRPRLADYEIILVNDQKRAAFRPAIEQIVQVEPYVRVLHLSQAKSDSVAASAGLETSLGDYVCVMDSEFAPPERVPDAVLAAMEGADVVFVIDRNQTGRDVLGRLLARAFSWYARQHLKLDVTPGMGTFRCMNRYAVNALTRLAQPYRYYRIWGDYVGLTTVRTYHDGRGQRHRRGLSESIDEAIDIVISTSPHPLRMLSSLGLFFASANLLYVAYVVGIFLFKPQVASGWTTLSLQIACLSFVVIVLLAAMGEYVGRLLERTSTNPAYWVLEERTSKHFAEPSRRNVVEQSAVTDISANSR
jgi:polyisoprenyl-phosphate glycosyltransferase